MRRWQSFRGEPTGLARCPCGEVPEFLYIDGYKQKWAHTYGSCCGEWSLEFRSDYLEEDDPELLGLAVEAWNAAPRGGIKEE